MRGKRHRQWLFVSDRTAPLSVPMETTDPGIGLLTTGDLEGAFGLSAAAGWNQRLADWRMLLQLAPAGRFAAGGRGRTRGPALRHPPRPLRLLPPDPLGSRTRSQGRGAPAR